MLNDLIVQELRNEKFQEAALLLDRTFKVIDETDHRITECPKRRSIECWGSSTSSNRIPIHEMPKTAFLKATHVARCQNAKGFELRAATSLARLWREKDRPREAYGLLAPIYGWFTEGTDTSDPREARAVMAELE